MKRYFNIVRALVEGKAVVIAKSPDDEKTVDVMVGKKLTKDFAVNSLVSTLRTIAL